jgi:SAM-dependent methyltransferase
MNDSFDNKVDFWIKDQPKVLGDLCNCPAAINLLGDMSGKIVADIGCGTGYISRILASNNVIVWGSDNSLPMLEAAQKEELKKNLGINYVRADIDNLPYENNSVDAALLISVLVYNEPDLVKKGLLELSRILKKGGALILAHPHPSIAYQTNPNIKWLKYKSDVDITDGSALEQCYIDKDGIEFHANVWHYSTEFYKSELDKLGFADFIINDLIVTKDMINASPHWGTLHGYFGFQNIKATKQ